MSFWHSGLRVRRNQPKVRPAAVQHVTVEVLREEVRRCLSDQPCQPDTLPPSVAVGDHEEGPMLSPVVAADRPATTPVTGEDLSEVVVHHNEAIRPHRQLDSHASPPLRMLRWWGAVGMRGPGVPPAPAPGEARARLYGYASRKFPPDISREGVSVGLLALIPSENLAAMSALLSGNPKVLLRDHLQGHRMEYLNNNTLNAPLSRRGNLIPAGR